MYEWRAPRGEAYEWTPLTGEFTVNAAGMVSLPMLGEVPAAELTTAALAESISRRLQAAVGLVQKPQTSLEVSQYRPFYVIGAVNQPGAYPYRRVSEFCRVQALPGALPANRPGLRAPTA